MTLTIKTNNLLLRPIRDTDIEHVFKGLSHPEVIRYYDVSFFSLEATKVQMDWNATIEREQTGQSLFNVQRHNTAKNANRNLERYHVPVLLYRETKI